MTTMNDETARSIEVFNRYGIDLSAPDAAAMIMAAFPNMTHDEKLAIVTPGVASVVRVLSRGELNTVVDYMPDKKIYSVDDADSGFLVCNAATLQEAWDHIKDYCESLEVKMGHVDYRTRGPDALEDVAR